VSCFCSVSSSCSDERSADLCCRSVLPSLWVLTVPCLIAWGRDCLWNWAVSHWGDATAIRSRKKSTTQNSWRVVIASWSRWWEKLQYELKVRPVGDCKVIFFLIESQSRRLSGRPDLTRVTQCCKATLEIIRLNEHLRCKWFCSLRTPPPRSRSTAYTNTWGRDIHVAHHVKSQVVQMRSEVITAVKMLMWSYAL
jgi:hypothetical protein